MIKTEDVRHIIEPVGLKVEPPKEVVQALKRVDPELELIWNCDDGQWEFYRLKAKGVTRSEDLLHWQMSAPTKGTCITPGIVDWIRKFDSSEGGRLSQDDLKKRFLENFANYRYEDKRRREKDKEDWRYSYKHLIDRTALQRTAIAVPKCIGMKNGKPVYILPPNRKPRPPALYRKGPKIG